MKAYTCFKTHESIVLGLRERENWASMPLCSNCYFEELLFPWVIFFKNLLIDLNTNKIIADLVFTITPTIRFVLVTCYYNFEALLHQNYLTILLIYKLKARRLIIIRDDTVDLMLQINLLSCVFVAFGITIGMYCKYLWHYFTWTFKKALFNYMIIDRSLIFSTFRWRTNRCPTLLHLYVKKSIRLILRRSILWQLPICRTERKSKFLFFQDVFKF